MERKQLFAEGTWGCLVSKRADVREAKALGASWVVASHVGLLPGGGPAAVMALMPYADANGQVLDMGPELVEEADGMPVLAGVLAMDQFRECGQFLHVLAEAGFAGIQTFPSVGILGGGYRHLLEDAALGREMELHILGMAVKRGMRACGVAFSPGEAAEVVATGADMVLAHLPLPSGGGMEEWSASNRKLFTAAVDAVGAAAVATAFVPETGKTCKQSLLGESARLQFETVACARLNLA